MAKIIVKKKTILVCSECGEELNLDLRKLRSLIKGRKKKAIKTNNKIKSK